MLEEYKDFSDDQISLICKKSIENNQINQAGYAIRFLSNFIAKYKEKINPKDFKTLSELISRKNKVNL